MNRSWSVEMSFRFSPDRRSSSNPDQRSNTGSRTLLGRRMSARFRFLCRPDLAADRSISGLFGILPTPRGPRVVRRTRPTGSWPTRPTLSRRRTTKLCRSGLRTGNFEKRLEPWPRFAALTGKEPECRGWSQSLQELLSDLRYVRSKLQFWPIWQPILSLVVLSRYFNIFLQVTGRWTLSVWQTFLLLTGLSCTALSGSTWEGHNHSTTPSIVALIRHCLLANKQHQYPNAYRVNLA